MYSRATDLKDSFFQNFPEAAEGKELLDRLLPKEKQLKHLLRDHRVERVTGDETWDRDNVDFFIAYFSYMTLAGITGYISEPLPSFLKQEGKKYLAQESVRRYYSELYPQLLPEILVGRISGSRARLESDISDPQDASAFFKKFTRLNNSVNDDDIYSFLWLLDSGAYREADLKWININDLKKVLLNPKRYVAILEDEELDSYLKDCLLGFFKYCNFLENYSAFLSSVSEFKIAQSAFWHYHGYWFIRVGKHLKDVVEKFFEGIEANAIKDANILETVRANKKAYLDAIEDLCYSSKYETPLKKYYRAESATRSGQTMKADPGRSEPRATKPSRSPGSFFESRYIPSPALAAVLGHKSMTREQVMKNLLAYAKANKLLSSQRRSFIEINDELSKVLGMTGQVSIQRVLNILLRKLKKM